MKMLMSITFGAALGFAATADRTEVCTAIEEGFRSPPMDARPQTWWHWMNGNVTKEGITADLEAMAEIGLGGASIFDAGCNIPPGPLKFNTPEWFEAILHAAKEARRLGLSLCLPNCSGWSSSGGPWVKPEDGMKFLAHAELRVAGPAHLERALPELPDQNGFAKDIAVLAVPVPSAELETMEKAGVKIAAPSPHVRTFSFPHPFAASGAFFRLKHGKLWQVEGEMKVETSDDGVDFTELCTADANVARRGDDDLTDRYAPFPRTATARHWRLSFRFWDWESKRDFGSNVSVASVSIGRRRSISHLYDKTLHKRMEVTPDPDIAAPDQVVPKSAVRDVTAAIGADGMLRWDVPHGEWRIIRLGYVLNPRKNHPASENGEGLEVDKLSGSALGRHFENYAARLVKHLGRFAGDVPSGLNGILVDSYEVGCQNWTQGFEREFAARRGYSMTPYLPVLAGVVVGSVDESERFLYDFRRTVADLFAANYSGALAAKCHDYGLKLTLEPYGNCPCDDLEYGENADIPQCEFWSWIARDGERGVACGNAKLTSYIAHVWGKRYVGAEAFTSFPGAGGRWLTTPWSIKAQGDRVFAKGVNRLVFHRFAHQPWTKPARLPGMTMGVWGIHLDRTQTWWRFGRPWMDYLSRCQWMLQEGTFAADVLFWHGEEAPSRGGHLVGFPEDFADHPVPAGYDRDVCSTRALMKLRVDSDGRIVAPGGVRYRLLVLQDVSAASPEVLDAVERILDAGGKVYAPRRPVRMPGLCDWPHGDAKIAARSAEVWGKGVGSGAAAEGVSALGLEPDFICRRAPEGLVGETAWIHRIYPGGMDAYFVACPNASNGMAVCSFRVDGREPELWDAETGEVGIQPVAWRREAGRTEVTFWMKPSGSAFVVFRRNTDKVSGGAGLPACREREIPLSARWTLTFPVDWYSGGTAEKTVELAGPTDWTSFEDPDLKYFSGVATYRVRIAPPALKSPPQTLCLDLGELKHLAEVYVNGRKTATLWRPPYRVSLQDAYRANPSMPIDVELRVANLWPNRLIGDDRLCAADCEWPKTSNFWRRGIARIPDWVKEGKPSPTGRKTFATWLHWAKSDKLLPSGILGPVRLVATP